MPAEDLRKIEQNAVRVSKKTPVKHTQKAKVKGGQVAALDSVISDAAMITADKANHFLIQQAGQVQVAGEQFADAIYQLSENVPNLFAQSALNRLNQLTSKPKEVPGWQYDSKLSIDFNSTLEQALTVGDEKPLLTSTMH